MPDPPTPVTALSGLPPVEPFDNVGDMATLAPRWEKWLQTFKLYCNASGIGNTQQKRALLLFLAGPGVREIVSNLGDTGADFETAEAKLNEHFEVNKDSKKARQEFLKVTPKPGETIVNFAQRLQTAAKYCGYQEKDNIIMDKVLSYVTDKHLRRKLMDDRDLTLTKMLQIIGKYDDPAAQMIQTKEVEKPERTFKVSHARGKPRQQRGKCWRCTSREHYAKDCPAREMTCYRCSNVGHLSKACHTQMETEKTKKSYAPPRKSTGKTPSKKPEEKKSEKPPDVRKKTYAVTEEQFQPTGEENEHSFCVDPRLPSCQVMVNDKPITCLVDSCSSCNVMSQGTAAKLGVDLKPCVKRLYPFGTDTTIPVVGSFDCEIVYGDQSVYTEFVVVEKACSTLLGKESAIDLGILSLHFVNSVQNETDYVKKYPKMFKGVGKLNNFKLKLHVDETVEPVAQPQRRIPYSMRKAVERKIDELLELDIIEPVTGPTSWVSPPVVVPKPNSDDVRFCIDMRRANEAVKRVRYPIPTIDDVLTEMNGSTKFTKIDLKWAFHQMRGWHLQRQGLCDPFGCDGGRQYGS